jgi:hypothetical protein
MSLVLAIPISAIFLIGGMKLNISPDYLLIVLAIIYAGGLAGCKD